MNWDQIQNCIDNCRTCEQNEVYYLKVPVGNKRHPIKPPPSPTKLLFISVAPPWGGAYFWDESKPDGLRKGLFEAIEAATSEHFKCMEEFWNAGYFLVPAVKCRSGKSGKDHKPLISAIKNCVSHLKDEMELIQPERILALGAIPMKSISIAFGLDKVPEKVTCFYGKSWKIEIVGRSISVAGTYFPGNKRHQGFSDIIETINNLLRNCK